MLSKNIKRAARQQCARYSSKDNTAAQDPEIHLYSSGTSIQSQIVRLTLAELGLKFNKIPMDTTEKMDNHNEWYAKINPKMTVPTLKYNYEVLTDSS